MRRICFLVSTVLLTGLLLWSCTKELSFEKGATATSGTITGTSVFTLNDCSATVVAGNYIKDTALNSGNTITLSVNVDSLGTWNINIGPLGGMTFAGSGTFTVKGIQTITLAATGKPNAAGTFTVGITSGASTCSFNVVVTDNGSTGGTGNTGGTLADNSWKFTEGGKTYSGSLGTGQLTTQNANGISIAALEVDGKTAVGDSAFGFSIADVSGTISSGETYNSSITGVSNALAVLELDDENLSVLYSGGIATTGTTLSLKVTSHNAGTKKVEGTFSGTVKDGSGTTKTISGGQFKMTYQ